MIRKLLTMLFVFTTAILNTSAQKTIFFTGTTNQQTEKPICVYELDESTGSLRLINKLEGGKGPSYICISTDGKYLYAGDETIADPEKNESRINAYKIDNNSWQTENIGSRSSHGIHPCHLSIDSKNRRLFTANYVSGSIAVHSIEENGEPGKAISVCQFKGSGPNASRQESPHAHFIIASPDDNYVYSCDLGTDKIMIFQSLEEGEIVPNKTQTFLSLAPGSGPRHMVFHPNKNFAFILTELSNEVISCHYQPKDGSLKIVNRQSSLEIAGNENSFAAAIRIHSNGKYLYCSNRGENSIAVFKINRKGRLSKIQSFKEKIGIVRDFNISPSGKYLIAGNQDKNEIIVLKIDKKGKLSATNGRIEAKKVTCIAFYPN